MTEPVNDINPTVDKVTFIELDDQTSVSDFEGEDDFFICRKCNKIFKNLPEYLEHKVKDENYRISQMRSKVDRRMVLPQLVQKQKRQTRKKKLDDTLEREEVNGQEEPSDANPSKQSLCVSVTCELSVDKATGNEIVHQGKQEVKQLVNIEEVLTNKRGRKKKSTLSVQSTEALSITEENTYICTICDRKFRREATLRWHQKYDHRNKKDDEEESDSSENEVLRETLAEGDEDYRVDDEQVDSENLQLHEGGVKLANTIRAIIAHSKDIERQQGGEETSKKADEFHSTVKVKVVKQLKETREGATSRPYSCEICGRSFKELTVLKAHGVVHSDERKFVCNMENCPYGFKTKGGLVRHMRRHTGERPYACDKCGRAFSESGALTRHMKARRNCSQTPDSAYPRYMKNWTYHPNIPAVIDPAQRDAQQGRSTLHRSMELVEIAKIEEEEGEIHYLITDGSESDVVTAEIIEPPVSGVDRGATGLGSTEIILPRLVTDADSALEIKLEQEQTADAEEWNVQSEENQEPSHVMTVAGTEIVGDVIKTLGPVCSEQQDVLVPTVSQQHSSLPTAVQLSVSESSTQEPSGIGVPEDEDLIELKKNAEVEFLKPTQCHVCKKDLEAVEGLEIHLRSHLADQPSRCGLCHFLSQDREELRQHILSLHYESLNNIEASVLSMEEEEGGGLKGETIQDRKAILRDALVAVKQLYSLKKNKVSTEIEKPTLSTTGSLQCMVCNRFFRGSSYLRQHMRTHTGDRPHQCQLCLRSFTSRDILKKHMYVHKEQRDFKCGECGKLFKRMAHVQQHLRIHSQERSFRCTVCDKLFKTQNSLKVHLRTHSGINPYKCHVCGRHFRERGSLQRHMRLHTGEKPYKCPLCNRGFAEQGTLSRHLKAKMPCSASHNTATLASNQNSSSTMLAQFSSMVADTQQYILPEVDSGQQYILPAVQEQMGEEYVVLQTIGEGTEEIVENIEVITEEGLAPTTKPDVFSEDQDQNTETLQIFDSSTGESIIIVADKSIVNLVRGQQVSLETNEGGSSLQKIRDILLAANRDDFTATAVSGDLSATGDDEDTSMQSQKISEPVHKETVSPNHVQKQSLVTQEAKT